MLYLRRYTSERLSQAGKHKMNNGTINASSNFNHFLVYRVMENHHHDQIYPIQLFNYTIIQPYHYITI